MRRSVPTVGFRSSVVTIGFSRTVRQYAVVARPPPRVGLAIAIDPDFRRRSPTYSSTRRECLSRLHNRHDYPVSSQPHVDGEIPWEFGGRASRGRMAAMGLPSNFVRKGLLLLRSGYVRELASASYPYIPCGGGDFPCVAGGVCGERWLIHIQATWIMTARARDDGSAAKTLPRRNQLEEQSRTPWRTPIHLPP